MDPPKAIMTVKTFDIPQSSAKSFFRLHILGTSMANTQYKERRPALIPEGIILSPEEKEDVDRRRMANPSASMDHVGEQPLLKNPFKPINATIPTAATRTNGRYIPGPQRIRGNSNERWQKADKIRKLNTYYRQLSQL
ncbi:hypothetical protein MMC13_002650 [Lambiella insularis]|nr:hypothetical protein [Lambiella insularis]